MGITDSRRFVVDIAKLQDMESNFLKTVFKEGEKHLKYFATSMDVFKYPESRLKSFDTVFYENALPIIVKILKDRNELI